MRDTSSWPNISYKIAWRYSELLLNYQVYKNVWKNKRGITWKKRRGTIIVVPTHHLDLIHIPTKLHEDIPKGYWVMARTRMFGKNNRRGITWKLRKGEQSFMWDTSSWPYTYSYKSAWRYPEWLLSCGAYKSVDRHTVGKINKRGITCKIRKKEQSFLCVSHRHDLVHIPIKLYEDIPYGYCVMARTRMFGKKLIKGA